jgi:hypothetical protein
MSYEFKVNSYKRTPEGVILQVFVPDTKIIYEMFKFNSQLQEACGELKIDDGRHITAKQKKRIYLTIKDIANHLGYLETEAEQVLVENFNIVHNENLSTIPNTTIAVARKFIAYLLDFVISNDIGLSDYALNRIDDLDSFLTTAMYYRRCWICGSPSDIHHAFDDKVGMGSNRCKINNVGRKAASLCRIHHNQLHTMSEEKFYKKYKIHPIVLTEELVKKLNL